MHMKMKLSVKEVAMERGRIQGVSCGLKWYSKAQMDRLTQATEKDQQKYPLFLIGVYGAHEVWWVPGRVHSAQAQPQ